MSQQVGSPRLRLATEQDFERVQPLLAELTNRLDATDWKRLFTNHWKARDFRPGIILEHDNEVVGFIATIYKRRSLGGQQILTCNLSSWIVREAYRSSSILLLLKLLRDKQVIYTSFSSNEVSYEVYKRLKFEDDETYAHVFYPFPSLRMSRCRIITDRRQIEDTLTPAELELYRDHSDFKCRFVLIQAEGGGRCWMAIGVRDRKMKVYYASDPGFVRRHVRDFRWRLMRRFGVVKLYVGGNIIEDSKPFLTRRKDYRHPHQIKSSGSRSVDRLYSELLLLDM